MENLEEKGKTGEQLLEEVLFCVCLRWEWNGSTTST